MLESRVAMVSQHFELLHKSKHPGSLSQAGDDSYVAQRFKRIKNVCLLFQEHLQTLKALPLTGNLTESDYLQAATACYNCRTDIDDDKRAIYRYFGDDGAIAGTPFLFPNCYLWLIYTCSGRQIDQSIDKARLKKEEKTSCVSGPNRSSVVIETLEEATMDPRVRLHPKVFL